jgi:hypothetical protein
LVGLIHLRRFCQSGDADDLHSAVKIRNWLAANLVEPSFPAATGILRNEYPLPDPPYTSRGGFGSALAQAPVVLLLLRVRPSEDRQDDEKLQKALHALVTPIEGGGFYSRSGNRMFWEEVASDTPSLVINGDIVTMWNVDQILKILPDSNEYKSRLAALNKEAKQTIVNLAPTFFLGTDKVLYDLRPGAPNTRGKGDYPVRLMMEGYKWLISDGYTSLQASLDRLMALPPKPAK